MKTKILVSACLLGENCKYNGGNNYNEDVAALSEYFEIIPICPEYFGGLAVPREPCEIKDGRVISKDGVDLTDEFNLGAQHTLYIAQEKNCAAALLKEHSPSCGYGEIYDGTFTHAVVKGNGVTADLLEKNDLLIFGESKVKKILELFT